MLKCFETLNMTDGYMMTFKGHDNYLYHESSFYALWVSIYIFFQAKKCTSQC